VYALNLNKLPRRKQRGIKNLIKIYYAASGGEFQPGVTIKVGPERGLDPHFLPRTAPALSNH
jgi:hypothetical protein